MSLVTKTSLMHQEFFLGHQLWALTSFLHHRLFMVWARDPVTCGKVKFHFQKDREIDCERVPQWSNCPAVKMREAQLCAVRQWETFWVSPGNGLGSTDSPFSRWGVQAPETRGHQTRPYESGADGHREKPDGLVRSPGAMRPTPHWTALDSEADS